MVRLTEQVILAKLIRCVTALAVPLHRYISSQFTLKMCVTGQNREKFTKPPLLGVQGHSRSSMLINLKSPSPVLIIMCSMSVPLCNSFHT